MTITYSVMMLMMMACLVDPVGAEVDNQSNSACNTLPHSWHGYVGPAEVLVVE